MTGNVSAVNTSHKSPEATAQEVGEHLKANPHGYCQTFNAVTKGLNLLLPQRGFNDIKCQCEVWRTASNGRGPLAMVEYSSPNTNNKPHLGQYATTFRLVACKDNEITATSGEDKYSDPTVVYTHL